MLVTASHTLYQNWLFWAAAKMHGIMIKRSVCTSMSLINAHAHYTLYKEKTGKWLGKTNRAEDQKTKHNFHNV